eukprot:scaffold10413_cov130-Cylindrotheca_fusiformis.AAC.3
MVRRGNRYWTKEMRKKTICSTECISLSDLPRGGALAFDASMTMTEKNETLGSGFCFNCAFQSRGVASLSSTTNEIFVGRYLSTTQCTTYATHNARMSDVMSSEITPQHPTSDEAVLAVNVAGVSTSNS